jgi:hypothetical protein
MSAEHNKATARRLFDEVWSQGNLDAADELVGHRHYPFRGGKNRRGLVAVGRAGLAATARHRPPDRQSLKAEPPSSTGAGLGRVSTQRRRDAKTQRPSGPCVLAAWRPGVESRSSG